MEDQPIFKPPCFHRFHHACITTNNHICPICGINSPLTTFDDDEPLQSDTPPPPPPAHQPSSSTPTATATATIKSFPEFPAVAASDSPSDFSVLIKARAPPPPPGCVDRAPIDLVAVLDVSGSMLGQKLVLLKRAVRFIIDTLGPSDRLSIVTFSSKACRVLNLRRMSGPGRVCASVAVDSLTANGSTNIKDGLETGVRVFKERRHRNPVPGLILLSDGKDNASSRWFDGHHRPEQDGYRHLLPSHIVPIHTFGFGSDHDPRALHAISDASGGTFSFIEAEEVIQDAFAMCIGGLLSVVAQQVELIVSSASAGVLIASVASGSYPSRILNHGLAASIDVSDLYAEEEKDFLVHISIPAKGQQQQDGTGMPLLTVRCSYKDPLTQEAIHVEGETAVIRRPDSLSPEDRAVSLIVDGQRNRILVAESMREAQGRAERGDLEGAKAVLTNCRSALSASVAAQAGDELCGWLDVELQEIQKRMANMHVYARSGRAYALSGMSSHKKQRAAAGAVASGANLFMASAKKKRQSAAFGASSGVAAAAAAAGSGIVGYQTQAMRDMVERSHQYARENPLAPSGKEIHEQQQQQKPF